MNSILHNTQKGKEEFDNVMRGAGVEDVAQQLRHCKKKEGHVLRRISRELAVVGADAGGRVEEGLLEAEAGGGGAEDVVLLLDDRRALAAAFFLPADKGAVFLLVRSVDDDGLVVVDAGEGGIFEVVVQVGEGGGVVLGEEGLLLSRRVVEARGGTGLVVGALDGFFGEGGPVDDAGQVDGEHGGGGGEAERETEPETDEPEVGGSESEDDGAGDAEEVVRQ
mmetsp:Transcript_28567/g.87456  ORF Transcript_28567/g.87456 Transcript_28567/m.87456 type:complete len:222 (-) Transcript_28567:1283-1948(-)